MSMLLAHQLHEVRDRILLLKQRLGDAKAKELSVYQSFLEEQIRFLDDALDQARIPDRYRVAVVGRFKVGKSSFVNKLAGERLAGVDTNPETAAISVFRYGDKTRAEIELVSDEEWNRLKQDHEDDPKNPEVKRYDQYVNFNSRPSKQDKDGKEQPPKPIDLESLVKRWIKPGGIRHAIESPTWGNSKDKKQFLAEIRQFTSSQEPLHYLVNKLTIYAPIPILRDNIELIDTPGLDDTERFRVSLTEDLVRDVDAILFLTVSGASYSQSDKDFIVRQLRQKTIKHLQIIVTKSDATYDDAVRDAKEDDETPPTYSEFTKKEIDRVKAQAKTTLSELLDSNQLSDTEGYYFIEQLDNVPIHLISTKYHDDGDTKRGGIDDVRENIYHILSTSHRFEQARAILDERLESSLTKLKHSYRERLGTIETDFDPLKVKNEIESIKDALGKKLDFFTEKAESHIVVLKKQQDAFRGTLPLQLDMINLLAREALGDLEREDLLKHWKTRRGGRWGYLNDLQAKVADRIFPKVESQLNELRTQMTEFMKNVSNSLQELQLGMRDLEEEHQVSSLEPLALANSQEPFFKELETLFSTLSASERDQVISRLDEFVSDEVKTRLEQARQKVSDIWGKGTMLRQGDQVTSFYAELRKLMGEALRGHLEKRFIDYALAIIERAESIAPRIRAASDGLIVQRLQAIESTLAITTADEKTRVIDYLTFMAKMLDNFAADATIKQVDQKFEVGEITEAPVADDEPRSKLNERHYEIKENEVGYTYERIFRPYIDDATEITVEDPYVRLRHQVQNFSRFCVLAIRLGKAQKILLKTGKGYSDEDLTESDSYLENLGRELKRRGIDFRFERLPNLHDREISFNNGWVVKIGRGLDIYNKPESWASLEAEDFSLRHCRQTKVDIFRVSSD